MIDNVIVETVWQSMDSCPKNGTPFLARGQFDGPFAIAKGIAVCTCEPASGGAEGEYYYNIEADPYGHYTCKLDGWLPLEILLPVA